MTTLFTVKNLIAEMTEEEIFEAQKYLNQRFNHLMSESMYEDEEEDEAIKNILEPKVEAEPMKWSDYYDPYFDEPDQTTPVVKKPVVKKTVSKRPRDDEWLTVRKTKTFGRKQKKTKRGNRTLIVYGLPYQTYQNEMYNMFETYGELEYLNILRDSAGQCKGTCFVKFQFCEDAEKAIEINQYTYRGRSVKVQFADSKYKSK